MKLISKKLLFICILMFAGIFSATTLQANSFFGASVEKVVSGKIADMVLINAGYDNNFVAGACCQIEKKGIAVAEIIIAEARKDKSVGLIISLEENQMITTGDTVSIKTILFN